MGPKQPTTPDIPEQNHPGHDRASSDDLRCLRALGQFSQVSAETGSSPPQTLVKGDPIVSVSRNVSYLSLDREGLVGFDKNQDMTSKRIRIVGKQSQDGLASPLPVENETVHGQDQLFDDNKSAPSPSEPHTGDEHSDLSPCTPSENQCLPVPLEPSKDALDAGGLTKLLGGSGSWAILTERASEGRSRHLPSKVPFIQEVGGFNQLDTKLTAGGDGLQSNESNKLRPKITDINHQSTRQDLSPPVTPVSPNHLVLCERDHNLLNPNHPSHDTNSFNNQDRYPHSAPMHMLYSQVLSGLAGPSRSWGSYAYDGTTIDPEKTKDRLPSDNVEPHLKRSKQRGRPRKKSFESLERAHNPRELLFQEGNDDVNIRAARFRRSKRRLS